MITCRLHRNAILRGADENTPLPKAAAEHVRNCPACRQLHESHASIAQCLIAGAPAQRREPSPFLHARIMRSLDREQIETGRTPGFRWVPATAIAACLVIAGILVVNHRNGAERMTASQSRPTRIAPEVRTASLLPALPKNLKLPNETQLREWTGKIDQPLQTEMQLVVSDARTAVNSLDNLLPPTVRSTLLDLAGN